MESRDKIYYKLIQAKHLIFYKEELILKLRGNFLKNFQIFFSRATIHFLR